MPAKNKPANTNMLSDPRAGFQAHLRKKYVNAYWVGRYDNRSSAAAVQTGDSHGRLVTVSLPLDDPSVIQEFNGFFVLAHPVSAYFSLDTDSGLRPEDFPLMSLRAKRGNDMSGKSPPHARFGRAWIRKYAETG